MDPNERGEQHGEHEERARSGQSDSDTNLEDDSIHEKRVEESVFAVTEEEEEEEDDDDFDYSFVLEPPSQEELKKRRELEKREVKWVPDQDDDSALDFNVPLAEDSGWIEDTAAETKLVPDQSASLSEETFEKEQDQRLPTCSPLQRPSGNQARDVEAWKRYLHAYLWEDDFTKLYYSHALSSWGDRMGSFCLPLVLTTLFPSTILPISLMLFVSNMLAFLLGPMIGSWVDNSSRMRVVAVSLIAQNVFLLLSLFSLFLLQSYATKDGVPWTSVGFLSIFGFGLIVNALSGLFSMASTIAVERDWVVVLCRSDSGLLMRTNAVMKRIDLLSNTLAPSLMGTVLQLSGSHAVLVSIVVNAIWNVVSFFPELGLLITIYKKNQSQLEKKEDEKPKERVHPLVSLKNGWTSYIHHHVLLPSMAFVFLFFTVISPGGLMASYLTSRGVPFIVLGVFSAIAAVFGVLATIFVPKVSGKASLENLGLSFITLQWITLLISFVVFVSDAAWLIYVFLTFVIISRFFLWSFDLIERQIMQESIEAPERGTISSVEGSLTKLFTLFATLMGVFLGHPDQFWILCFVSMLSVGVGAVIFAVWTVRRSREKSLTITPLDI